MRDVMNRMIVEMVKNADAIEITVNKSSRDSIVINSPRGSKKLYHDIGLAIQDYFIKKERDKYIR